MAVEITKAAPPAQRKTGLTVGDLARLVADAGRYGIPSDTPLTNVRASMRGRLISVSLSPEGDGR